MLSPALALRAWLPLWLLLATLALALRALPLPMSAREKQARVAAVAEALAEIGIQVDLSALPVRELTPEEYHELNLAAMRDEIEDGSGYWKAQQLLDGMIRSEGGLFSAELAGKDTTWHPAAFYDPEREELGFVSGVGNFFASGELVAHELGHAWRAQRAAQGTTPFRPRGGTELRSIQRLLEEGQAQLVAALYACSRSGIALEALSAQELSNPSLIFGSGPSLARIYNDGLIHAFHCFLEGGWPALDGLLSVPPPSSEQILHPEKRGRDRPVEVELPEWPADAASAELVFEDVLGEMGIDALLGRPGAERVMASMGPGGRRNHIERRITAAGWDGDRLRIYRLEDETPALMWRSVWDREEDATDFSAALRALGLPEPRRAGVVVDLAVVGWGAEEEEAEAGLRRRLEAALAAHPFSVESDLGDSITTAAAEARILREAEWSSQESAGRWRLRRLGISFPIPDGWTLEGKGELQRLTTMFVSEGKSFTLAELEELGVELDESGGMSEEDQERHYGDHPEVEYAGIQVVHQPAFGRSLEDYRVEWLATLRGHDGLRLRPWRSRSAGVVLGFCHVMESHQGAPASRWRNVEWVFLRRDRFVRVSATFNLGGWRRFRAAAERILDGIEWEEDA